MNIFSQDRPIPTNKTPSNNRWNLHLMEVGDSFDINFEQPDAQRLRVAICNYAKRNNKKFTTRREGDKLIVWRIE
jgi:hypothetical protein